MIKKIKDQFKTSKITLAEAFDTEDLECEGWVDMNGFKSVMMINEVPNDIQEFILYLLKSKSKE